MTSLSSVAFLVLALAKVTGKLHWSWLWVAAPLWVPFLLAALLPAGFALGAAL